MEICFVLVEPQVPENVGAAARALKTMGFSALRLVNTEQHRQPQAQWLAHGSSDLLDGADVYQDLPAAVADCQLVVGTTAKARAGFRGLLSPEELQPQLHAQANTLQRVALVFGREDRGLSNEDLEVCQLLTSIPLVNAYPSLNLSQAVMLYAYVLSSLNLDVRDLKPAKNAAAQFAALRQRSEQLLAQLDYNGESKLTEWARERLSSANADDVRFLHGLCAALEKKISG